ncbi:MAG TPA: sigma-70 family RNA polymerase sigma factor [Gemmataceae bacterium]|nr:sigma-70 family RNA polymerase sigma factor [Gemmataceae bacterium]
MPRSLNYPKFHVTSALDSWVFEMDLASPRPDSEETVRLLDRASAGDSIALNRLLASHRDAVRAFVGARLDPAVRARLDPSDVVQEAMAEVARRLADYCQRRPMPFHLWVRKAAYERALNARREHRAARRDVGREANRPDESSLALAHLLACSGPTPSEAAEANEAADRVAQALDDLSEADRELLILRQVDGLPYAEVAVLLDVEPAAARQRYGRALIRLQKALAAHGVA